MNDIEGAVRDNLRENYECTCDECVGQAVTSVYAAEPHLRRKHRQELLDELTQYIQSLHGTLPALPLLMAHKIVREYAQRDAK